MEALQRQRQLQQQLTARRQQQLAADRRFQQNLLANVLQNQQQRQDRFRLSRMQDAQRLALQQRSFLNQQAMQQSQNQNVMGLNEQRHEYALEQVEAQKADEILRAEAYIQKPQEHFNEKGMAAFERWYRNDQKIDEDSYANPRQKHIAKMQSRQKLRGLLNPAFLKQPEVTFAAWGEPEEKRKMATVVQTEQGHLINKNTGEWKLGPHPRAGQQAIRDRTGRLVPVEPGMLRTPAQLKAQAAQTVAQRIGGGPGMMATPELGMSVDPAEVEKEYRRLQEEQDKRPRYFYKHDGTPVLDPAWVEQQKTRNTRVATRVKDEERKERDRQKREADLLKEAMENVRQRKERANASGGADPNAVVEPTADEVSTEMRRLRDFYNKISGSGTQQQQQQRTRVPAGPVSLFDTPGGRELKAAIPGIDRTDISQFPTEGKSRGLAMDAWVRGREQDLIDLDLSKGATRPMANKMNLYMRDEQGKEKKVDKARRTTFLKNAQKYAIAHQKDYNIAVEEAMKTGLPVWYYDKKLGRTVVFRPPGYKPRSGIPGWR
jgi:hypothetical protein